MRSPHRVAPLLRWQRLLSAQKSRLMGQALAALLLFMPLIPAAAAIHCEGQVTDVALDDQGRVWLAVLNGPPIHAICSIKTQSSFLVDTNVCKSMHATLMTALVSGRTVLPHYKDVTACDQIGAWSAQPSFYHVTMR